MYEERAAEEMRTHLIESRAGRQSVTCTSRRSIISIILAPYTVYWSRLKKTTSDTDGKNMSHPPRSWSSSREHVLLWARGFV